MAPDNRPRRARALVVATTLALTLLALSACRDEPAPKADTAPRVVSISPSTTEAMFALGAERFLVGRSQQCDYPPAAEPLPSVGGYAAPNLEAVLALRPTLVIGERGPVGPELEHKLRAHGIDTYFPPVDDVAGVSTLLRTLGARFAADPAADRVVAQIDQRVARIRRWADGRPKVRAVLLFDTAPIYLAGPGGFPDELLRLAGGVNVISQGGPYPTVGIERLLVLDPDVIIDGSMARDAAGGLARLPGWSELRAVREARVRRLAGSAALRPGPRIAEGLADVARALHGEEPP